MSERGNRFPIYRRPVGTRTKNNKKITMAKKEESYNEALEKLRRIVSEIENGASDVDVLSVKVKEATRLIKLCKEKLFKADEEVRKVLEELDE